MHPFSDGRWKASLLAVVYSTPVNMGVQYLFEAIFSVLLGKYPEKNDSMVYTNKQTNILIARGRAHQFQWWLHILHSYQFLHILTVIDLFVILMVHRCIS